MFDDLETPQAAPRLSLVYVTPELVTSSSRFTAALASLYDRSLLSLFAIDEAHCKYNTIVRIFTKQQQKSRHSRTFSELSSLSGTM